MSGALKGLEVTVARAQAVLEAGRLDPQFYRAAYLAADDALTRHELHRIGDLAFVTDGPHGYHEVDPASPIAMLTAACANDWFARREGADTIATWVDDANKRSSLAVDDLILSTRGTVGNCAVVTLEVLPANLDQDLARIAVHATRTFRPNFVLAYLNCRFGQDYVFRHSSGMVQQGLPLAKVRDIPVPRLSDRFQMAISDVVAEAIECRRESVRCRTCAERALLASLGLVHWRPPELLSSPWK